MSTTCPNFGSSSEVSLWYGVEPSTPPADFAAATLTMYQVPMTGESIDAALTSAVSEQITPQRSYAGSKLVQGEVTGSFNYEAQAGDFMYDMLLAVLQANKTMAASGSGNWATTQAVLNGSTKHCLFFVKRVQVDTDKYDWYVFRGVQISSLSFEIQPNALITGTVNLMGIRPETPLVAAAKPAGWTLTPAPVIPLMSGVDSLQDFEIQDSTGTDTGVVMQNVSFTIDNQLRQQPAVGLGHPYAAGIASGRLMATYSGSAYYANPAIFTAFLNDSELKMTGKLLDSDGKGFEFLSDYVKVNSGSLPMAGGPDQDLMISAEFQAFEDGTHGTIKITKVYPA